MALIQGEAEPQAQSESDMPDPTVLSWPAADGTLGVAGFTVSDDAEGTKVSAERTRLAGTSRAAAGDR